MINKKDENYVYYLVSQNLKKQRKLKHLTQTEFADKCNYSEGFIMNIESENLYNLGYSCQGMISGNFLVMSFSINFLDSKYLEENTKYYIKVIAKNMSRKAGYELENENGIIFNYCNFNDSFTLPSRYN